MATGNIATTTVHRRMQFLRLSDGSVIEFEAMLNARMQITSDPDECVVAIFTNKAEMFDGVDLRLFRDEEHPDDEIINPDPTDIDCNAVNRQDQFFRCTDNSTIPFLAMLNSDLEITRNPNRCAVAIIQLPYDGLYRGVDLRYFDEEMLQ